MDITPLVPKGRQVITGYGNGGFTINHERVDGSLVVFPDTCQAWHIHDSSAISSETLAFLRERAEPVELLLIGTGKTLVMPDASLRAVLKSLGIALEVMDTGAACRTFNVLLLEDRKVAAALIAV